MAPVEVTGASPHLSRNLSSVLDPMTAAPFSALPDPETSPAFYDGVAIKRALAWFVDIAAIALVSAVLASLPFFLGWFIFPLIFIVVNFFYRVTTIASASATPGMQLFNIEFRNHKGEHLDGSTATLHTLTYFVANAFFIPQIISLFLMVGTPRGQGLHDMFVGTVALNRSS